jgi:hypothetical protein
VNLQEFRQKYPQYNQISDEVLVDNIYKKYYEDKLDRQQFLKLIGFKEQAPAQDGMPETEQESRPPLDTADISADKAVGDLLSAHQPEQPAPQLMPAHTKYLQKFADRDNALQPINPEAPAGQIAPGNIDLSNRPRVANPDGSISTIRSMSIGVPGGEVVIPTIGPNGENWTPEQAIDNFKKTGQNLGLFKDIKSANAFAQQLHEQQARQIQLSSSSGGAVDYLPAENPTAPAPAKINLGSPIDILETGKRQGALAAKSFNEATAGFMDRLDKMATKVSEITGMEKGGLFEAAKNRYLANAEIWNKRAGKYGLTDEIVGEIVGGAVPGVIEFSLGPAYSGAAGYAEGGVKEGAKQAVERAVLGKILHAVNTLKILPRTVAGAAVGATEAAARGEDKRGIAKSAAALGLFSATATGGKKVGIKEAGKDFTETIKQGAKPDAEKIRTETGKGSSGEGLEGREEGRLRLRDDEKERMEAEKEISIPEFKDTNEAVAFGEKATPEQVIEIKRLEDQARNREAELKAAQDFSEERTNNAYKAQLYREALEASRGEHPSQRDKRSPEQMLDLRGQRDIEFSEKLKKESQVGEVEIDLAKKGEPFKFNKDLEENWKKAHGVKKESVFARIGQTMRSMGQKMTREFEHMPKTGEFAEAGFALRKLAKQKDVAMERAIKDIGGVVLKLDKKDFNLFERKVFIDDMVETATEGKKLPFGLDQKKAQTERARLDAYIKDSPIVKDALIRRDQVWNKIKSDYSDSMKSIGFNVEERFARKNYFRHQVLEYVNMKGLFGTGKRLKTPTNRGFLKSRQGSALDINTNYLEAEHEIMAQMIYDTEIAKTIKRIDDKYNIIDKLRKQAKQEKTTYDQIIPEGYIEWQPREGNVFYMADTIPARLAEKITSGAIEELGISAKDIGKALAMGGKRRSMVIKQELADTLDNLYKTRSENPLLEARRKIMRGWKIWQLISPRRYPKYNLRNITGDLDAVIAGNPAHLKKVPEAVKDLYQGFVHKKMSPDLQDFFERGGMGATLQAQEMGSINSLKMFAKMIERKGEVKNIPFKVWSSYWKAARMSTDFREAILRYASYLKLKEEMEKSSDGLPKSYLASMPDEVKGLSNIKDRAYLMQNDLLGAYDRISVFGQAMREQIFPFWSWKEANAKRYWRLFHNAATEGKLASAVGRKFIGAAAVKTPYRAYRIGKFMIKAGALWGLLQVWNNTRYPEEEKQLPEGIRQKPHIILGRDDKGEIQYFSRLGAVPDLLEWIGLDAAPEYIDRLSRGESPAVIAKEMAKQPVNIMASGSVPFAKLALEVATRRALFPDVFKPRTIRDRGLHIAQSFGLDNEYKELIGLPRKPYEKSIKKAFIYSIDPLEAAYGETYSLKQKYLKKIGKYGEGFWLTTTGNDLYNVKLAIRYGDNESAGKYLEKYFSDGGTVNGITKSLMAMEPLYGMSDKEQNEFLDSLNKDELLKVSMAYEFFARMFDTEFNNSDEKAIAKLAGGKGG